MPRHSAFSPEVRERAIRMVQEQAASHASQWAAIRSIAEKLGCHPETLRNWMRRAEVDTGQRPGVTTIERAQADQSAAVLNQPTLRRTRGDSPLILLYFRIVG